MFNLLATLIVTTVPAPAGAVSACADPGPASADVAAGECEAAPLDLWYRMSRFADVDPGSVGAGPARRVRANPTLASCDAPKAPAQVSPPQAPPVALFALPALLLVQVPPYFDADAHALPARALAPPERPPRA
ncbi:MAG TPA: hypothetical protein VIF57_01410 [Polyangia bacterium]|jgi:hypothetical protein